MQHATLVEAVESMEGSAASCYLPCPLTIMPIYNSRVEKIYLGLKFCIFLCEI